MTVMSVGGPASPDPLDSVCRSHVLHTRRRSQNQVNTSNRRQPRPPFRVGILVSTEIHQFVMGQGEFQIVAKRWPPLPLRQDLDYFLVGDPLMPREGTLAPLDDDTIFKVLVPRLPSKLIEVLAVPPRCVDRKSTRLNSSHR